MIIQSISTSDVRLADHLYRWNMFKLRPAIVVQINEPILESFVITSNGINGFRLITLREFKGRGVLRRAVYDQGDSYLHSIKLTGTSFLDKKRSDDEVVENAYLLLNVWNTNPQCIQKLFPKDSSSFADLCCSNSQEQLREKLRANGMNFNLINTPSSRTAGQLTSTTTDDDNLQETCDDEHQCKVCLDRPCNIAFPCGHLACQQCSSPLNICHICRKDIHQKIPLYFA